jgi:hypothetical protein
MEKIYNLIFLVLEAYEEMGRKYLETPKLT